MKKILGLICAWGVEDWIVPCLKQAEKFCDEIFLCVSSHSKQLDNFEDNTLKIAKQFKKIKIIENIKKDFHSTVKAEILNKMLSQSDLYKVGNWIWILDADEFYFDKTFERIKEIINEGYYEKIEFEAKFFMHDMISYIKSSHGRIYKIKPLNIIPSKYFRFRPTQQWSPRFSKNLKTIKLKKDDEMFHYSMLTNPKMRLAQWETEYLNDKQNHKLKWFKNIFLKMDKKNQLFWIKKNYELNRIKNSVWLNNDFQGKINGEMFDYLGKHPETIEETNLKKITDFRKYYK
jgi:hypothetical protein